MKIGKKKLIATMLLMLLFSVLCGNSAKADVHSIDPYGQPVIHGQGNRVRMVNIRWRDYQSQEKKNGLAKRSLCMRLEMMAK